MSSYGALWRARLRLMRPGNGLMAAVAVLLGALVVAGADGVTAHFAATGAAALAAFLLSGFGNVVNDLADRDLDAVAHPERPLPSGAVTAAQARTFAGLLLLLGLYEAFVAAGWPTLLFAAANTALLGLYEWRLKARVLWGNLAVALLVASAFAFGAVAAGVGPAGWGPLWALMAMAFLTNVAREVLKDVQDVEADRAVRRTLPAVTGTATPLLLSFFMVNVAVVLSAVAWWWAPWAPWWGLPLLVADGVLVGSAAFAWLDSRVGQQGLKAGMVVALAAFGLGPLCEVSDPTRGMLGRRSSSR